MRGLFSVIVSLTVLGVPSATVVAAPLESSGNADGVLTWQLGKIDPGKQVRRTVLFAFEENHKDLAAALKGHRAAAGRINTECAADQPSAKGKTLWIRNDHTDVALQPYGAFFWEKGKQALACKHGGQLSRYGYRVHYTTDKPRSAGTCIEQRGKVDNLRTIEPLAKAGNDRITTTLATADGTLRIRLTAVVLTGQAAAVVYEITNTSKQPVTACRLTAYANIEARHDHGNDYATLDATTRSVIFVDVATGFCVAMTGDEPPTTGHVGLWPSSKQLATGHGQPLGAWRRFDGLDDKLVQRLARSAIPHPPAPFVPPKEPETRTLSETEAQAVLHRDWLFQADGKLTADRTEQEIRWGFELAARLMKDDRTPDLSADVAELARLLEQVDALRKAGRGGTDARDLYIAARRVKRQIAFKNPVVDFDKLLFIDNPYPQGAEWPHQARHRNGMMAVPGGRLLILEGLHPGGKLRKLAPERPGSFWRPDLSFDGRRVVFCYKAHDDKAFHLYEIGVDGTGLRQLTDGDYDDIDPLVLPSGKIMFCTTRCNTYVRCMPYTYTYVLARCDPDGRNIYLISRGNEPDWCPALLHDGRVIYSRWEYTDKALWRIQSLWTTNQDGTNTVAFWGNQSVWPDHLAEPRPIPGSDRVMFTGLAHHDWFAGSIGIIDPRKGLNFPHGLTKVTCDVAWPECGEPPVDPHESTRYHASGKYEAYKTPWPLSEEDFLVSARTGGRTGKFRLYLMDVYGNRELIYEGAYNIWHAMPLMPREAPPAHIDRVAWPGTEDARQPAEPGVLYSADVYEGVPDLPRGKAKYLRVVQLDAKTSSTWTRDGRFSGPCTSILQDDGVKRILGTVPIEADGSVCFEVPAGRSIHLQLLDEHYRALQTMRSFTGVMPGERRGCVGCHEMHSRVMPSKYGVAMQKPERRLEPPPWGAASISYLKLVQPVLDKHCGACHQGDGKGRKKLDLTLRKGDRWFFPEPYLTLVGGALMHKRQLGDKPGIAGAIMAENFPLSDPASYETFRPMRHLSYNSQLIEIAMSGKHHDVKVTGEDLRKLIAWVDANCPFRGEGEIREIPDPVFAGIDWLPVRPRTQTAPEVARP